MTLPQSHRVPRARGCDRDAKAFDVACIDPGWPARRSVYAGSSPPPCAIRWLARGY
jgi:hypothetical protein